MIVAEMGKGAASSRPCSASTPDGRLLAPPWGRSSMLQVRKVRLGAGSSNWLGLLP